MMLRPRWPSAGPIGGDGFAAPAGTCSFKKPVTFFAIALLLAAPEGAGFVVRLDADGWPPLASHNGRSRECRTASSHLQHASLYSARARKQAPSHTPFIADDHPFLR